MSERMKRLIKGLVVIVLICIPFYITPVVRADSGWDSDYDSGSSWDSGGSWDSGSDWSSGSDYGDSSIDSDFEVWFYFILMVVMIAVEAMTKDKRSHSRSMVSLYQDITQEHLSTVIPGGNLYTLKKMAFDSFVQIQNAWMNFDYDKLRELCTDELYNSYVSQLETLKLKNGKNIMNGFDNNDTKIIDVDEVNGEIILTVFMAVEFYDYVINTTNQKVTRGNKSVKIKNNYVMTFVMKADDGTKDDTKCPNCSAPIEHITSGECEYCHSTIVKKASKFVLSKKTNVNK